MGNFALHMDHQKRLLLHLVSVMVITLGCGKNAPDVLSPGDTPPPAVPPIEGDYHLVFYNSPTRVPRNVHPGDVVKIKQGSISFYDGRLDSFPPSKSAVICNLKYTWEGKDSTDYAIWFADGSRLLR